MVFPDRKGDGTGDMMASDYDEARLISKVLYLYYVEELTQSQIANRLGVSTPKVNRLLHQARSQKMVEIIIRTPFQYLFDLELRLQNIFNIPEAVVIPSLAENAATMVHTLGRAGANYLLEHLHDGDVIAIGGGTTVHAVVEAVSATRSYDVDVVPVVGGVQGRVITDVNYLAAQLAERLGGRAFQLHTPAFVETSAHRAALLEMGPIKEILDIARRANICLLGIGGVDPETSRFVQFTALSESEMNQIMTAHAGVGEISAIVYDTTGRPCAPEYADRVVGLTLQEIERIPFRIGVAGTVFKALPVFGALRGGYFHTIITDEAAAMGVLELFDGEFRRVGDRIRAAG
jgi:DNA-binding transcriptional regulator LsrR (DeoR family)